MAKASRREQFYRVCSELYPSGLSGALDRERPDVSLSLPRWRLLRRRNGSGRPTATSTGAAACKGEGRSGRGLSQRDPHRWLRSLIKANFRRAVDEACQAPNSGIRRTHWPYQCLEERGTSSSPPRYGLVLRFRQCGATRANHPGRNRHSVSHGLRLGRGRRVPGVAVYYERRLYGELFARASFLWRLGDGAARWSAHDSGVFDGMLQVPARTQLDHWRNSSGSRCGAWLYWPTFALGSDGGMGCRGSRAAGRENTLDRIRTSALHSWWQNFGCADSQSFLRLPRILHSCPALCLCGSPSIAGTSRRHFRAAGARRASRSQNLPRTISQAS